MRLRKHLPTVAIALVVSAVTASAPAIAHGVQHALFAHNADKVDGKHAAPATSTASKRSNKVASYARSGFLPNNALKKAIDADKLDGIDSANFATLALLAAADGTINDPDDPVDWSQLKGVPAGFADGEDASSGGITSVTAGLGLLGGGSSGDIELSANQSVLQARVTGSCSVGSYVRVIAADGQVTCGPDANTTYTAGQGLSLLAGAFNVVFGGNGAATTAARSDHNHNGVYLGIASKAADADRLDGFDSSQLVSDGCPGGWTSDGLICWRSTSDDGANLSLPQAVDFCRQRGGRLPLLSEFIAVKQSGIGIGSFLGDWTGSSAGDDNSIYINNQADANNMDGVRPNATTSGAFARCVRPLVNDLGSS